MWSSVYLLDQIFLLLLHISSSYEISIIFNKISHVLGFSTHLQTFLLILQASLEVDIIAYGGKPFYSLEKKKCKEPFFYFIFFIQLLQASLI